MPKVALYFPYVAYSTSDDSLSHCLPLFIASYSLDPSGFWYIFTVLFIEYNLKFTAKITPKWGRGQPSLHHSTPAMLDTRAFGAPHSRSTFPANAIPGSAYVFS